MIERRRVGGLIFICMYSATRNKNKKRPKRAYTHQHNTGGRRPRDQSKAKQSAAEETKTEQLIVGLAFTFHEYI